jgi:hypothetical protein
VKELFAPWTVPQSLLGKSVKFGWPGLSPVLTLEADQPIGISWHHLLYVFPLPEYLPGRKHAGAAYPPLNTEPVQSSEDPCPLS